MEPELEFDPAEARVLGVLVEKAFTTPEQYPLTLNATTLGCNQKSNRNPVLSLPESEVLNALNKLMVRGLVGRVLAAGSRVERFRHNALERLKIGEGSLAVLAELLMRGPQNPGELRARAARMHPMETQDELRAALDPLLERGFAKCLPPAPGSRAERYVQLAAPGLHPLDEPPAAARPAAAAPATAPGSPGLGVRVEALERELETLKRQLGALAAKLGEPLED